MDSAARRVVHSALAWSWITGGTAVFGPLVTVLGKMGRYDTADDMIVFWSRRLMESFGVRHETIGIENAGIDGPCVIMSNHRSHLDGPLLLATLPIRFGFVIKRSLAKIPVFGWGVTAARFVPIDRHDRADSVAGMKRAAALVREGRSILVFPEGTRSPTGDFLPFKKGGAVLAIEAGVPILPVAIAGTYAILPRDAMSPRPGRAVVAVGPPISPEGLTYEDREGLLGRVEGEIRRLYEVAESRLASFGA